MNYIDPQISTGPTIGEDGCVYQLKDNAFVKIYEFKHVDNLTWPEYVTRTYTAFIRGDITFQKLFDMITSHDTYRKITGYKGMLTYFTFAGRPTITTYRMQLLLHILTFNGLQLSCLIGFDPDSVKPKDECSEPLRYLLLSEHLKDLQKYGDGKRIIGIHDGKIIFNPESIENNIARCKTNTNFVWKSHTSLKIEPDNLAKLEILRTGHNLILTTMFKKFKFTDDEVKDLVTFLDDGLELKCDAIEAGDDEYQYQIRWDDPDLVGMFRSYEKYIDIPLDKFPDDIRQEMYSDEINMIRLHVNSFYRLTEDKAGEIHKIVLELISFDNSDRMINTIFDEIFGFKIISPFDDEYIIGIKLYLLLIYGFIKYE